MTRDESQMSDEQMLATCEVLLDGTVEEVTDTVNGLDGDDLRIVLIGMAGFARTFQEAIREFQMEAASAGGEP